MDPSLARYSREEAARLPLTHLQARAVDFSGETILGAIRRIQPMLRSQSNTGWIVANGCEFCSC